MDVIEAEMTVPDNGNYTHNGLQSKGVYSFHLFVVYEGSVGTSDSNGTSVTVRIAAPEPTITDVLSTSTNSTIQWSHPQPDFIVSYNVGWSYAGSCTGPGSPPDAHQVLSDGSRRNFTLVGLRPNSQYFVTLVAKNTIGATQSTVLINTTLGKKI